MGEWVVKAFAPNADYEKEENKAVSLMTEGFSEKYGFEVIGLARSKNVNQYVRLINKFCTLYAEENQFELNEVITVDDEEYGTYKALIQYYFDSNSGKRYIYLFPDFDWDIEENFKGEL